MASVRLATPSPRSEGSSDPCYSSLHPIITLNRFDLPNHLKRPWGKTLEFKRDRSAPDGALKMIVAVANTAVGTLLIEAEDRSRLGRREIRPAGKVQPPCR